MIRWPHQGFAFDQVTSGIDAGDLSICLASPTGGGKGRIICDLLEWAQSRDWPAILYTNRRMLTAQTIEVLSDHGIQFGVRAAGFERYENFDAPIQVASLQTEQARVFKAMKMLFHRAKLAIFDEAHLQKQDTAKQSMDLHSKNGCAIVGATATPVGLSGIYERLIVAGVNSELRKCKALVPCDVFAPSEIDTRGLKPTKTGEFRYGDIIKEIWTPTIYGEVIKHWKRLNPDARPAILFAPGVAESLGFAQEFEKQGVVAAHIDGDDVYVDGQSRGSSPEARAEIVERFRTGEIKVLCNRFVLREGIDIPEIYHGILATPIGSVVSYVQIVGRILRAHPTTPRVILQDHGGNYWRHGSPNADRDWASVWECTERQIIEQHHEKMREKKAPEPIVCPKCGAVRVGGEECYRCHFRQTKKSRLVIQKNGDLKEIFGDVFRPRQVKAAPDAAKLFERQFWRFRKAGMNFNQAYAGFYREHGYWPERTLPLMPRDSLDWSRKIVDVPFDRLVPKTAKPIQQPEAALFP